MKFKLQRSAKEVWESAQNGVKFLHLSFPVPCKCLYFDFFYPLENATDNTYWTSILRETWLLANQSSHLWVISEYLGTSPLRDKKLRSRLSKNIHLSRDFHPF